jgi:hypothetical protein
MLYLWVLRRVVASAREGRAGVSGSSCRAAEGCRAAGDFGAAVVPQMRQVIGMGTATALSAISCRV